MYVPFYTVYPIQWKFQCPSCGLFVEAGLEDLNDTGKWVGKTCNNCWAYLVANIERPRLPVFD